MLQVVGVGKCCGGAELFGDFYRAKTEFDLTKTQDSWVNNRQTCSNYTYKLVLLSTNENQCLVKHKKKVFKNLTEMLMIPYRSDAAE